MKIQSSMLYGALLFMPLMLCSCAVGLEKAPYTVLEKQGNLEIRQYQPYLVAETLVDADFKDAGNVAFGRLFGFISGQNRTASSIAMTAPVNQQPASEKIAMTAPVNQQPAGEKYRVSFVMPSEYTLESLPRPTNDAVLIKEVPGYKAAAIRYSGTWSQQRYQAKENALRNFIADRQLTPVGEPIFARYNSPFQLWFLRRNEVVIPIE